MGTSTKPNVTGIYANFGELISTERRQVSFMVPEWVYIAFLQKCKEAGIVKPTDGMCQILEQAAVQFLAQTAQSNTSVAPEKRKAK